MFRLLCVVLLALSLTGPGYGYEIHVAPSGNDNAAGSAEAPLKSLAAARDWTARGHLIRYNYFHHCGPAHAAPVPDEQRTEKHVVYEPRFAHGTSLIYHDDTAPGITVEGNILAGNVYERNLFLGVEDWLTLRDGLKPEDVTLKGNVKDIDIEVDHDNPLSTVKKLTPDTLKQHGLDPIPIEKIGPRQ